MEKTGVIVIIVVVLAIYFLALITLLNWTAKKSAEKMAEESESHKKKPKLDPPSEGNYYTCKQENMLADAELSQMEGKGWTLVSVFPESYHDYLGNFPEAPMVTRTRYLYTFKRKEAL